MSRTSTYAATDGAAYEYFVGRWTKRLAPLFVEAMAPAGNGPLLDVGCGTGSCALAMAAAYPGRPVYGIDVSDAYIAYAREQAAGEWPCFDTGDACAIPFEDGMFDGALSELALNFIPDGLRAACEMRRVVRPGGAAGACVWDFRGGMVFQRLFWDTAAGIDPKAGAARDRLFSGALALPDGLVHLWQEAGFRDVERKSITFRMEYRDFADYWEPFLGGQGPVGAYVAGLAPDILGPVEDAVRQAYLSGAPDGSRSLTATAWAVRGIVP